MSPRRGLGSAGCCVDERKEEQDLDERGERRLPYIQNGGWLISRRTKLRRPDQIAESKRNLYCCEAALAPPSKIGLVRQRQYRCCLLFASHTASSLLEGHSHWSGHKTGFYYPLVTSTTTLMSFAVKPACCEVVVVLFGNAKASLIFKNLSQLTEQRLYPRHARGATLRPSHKRR